MDPNANLAEQARLVGSNHPADRKRLIELRRALRDWLDAGGFEPDWPAHLRATHAYRRWLA